MSDEQQPQPQEPPHFFEFDELYHWVVRTDWHDPKLPEHVRAFEVFLRQHRDLCSNKYTVPCIENARGHCKAAGIPYSF